MKQLSDLKDRILNKKGNSPSEITSILEFIRELGCFSEVIGRDFEVHDKNGELIYTIRQKPMAISQLRNLMKEFMLLKKLDNEREAAKWKSK